MKEPGETAGLHLLIQLSVLLRMYGDVPLRVGHDRRHEPKKEDDTIGSCGIKGLEENARECQGKQGGWQDCCRKGGRRLFLWLHLHKSRNNSTDLI